MNRIWSFLGVNSSVAGVGESVTIELRVDPVAKWQQQKDINLARLIPKGKPDVWKNLFTSRDRVVFKQIAGEALIAWDYTLDMNW